MCSSVPSEVVLNNDDVKFLMEQKSEDIVKGGIVRSQETIRGVPGSSKSGDKPGVNYGVLNPKTMSS